MRRCWNNRRKRCRRPPLRVHVGEQPFQVKQLAYAVDEDDWCRRPWEEDDCGCCSAPPPPPWDFDEPFLPPFPLPSPESEEPTPQNDFPGETAEEETDIELPPPPHPGPGPGCWPPRPWPPRPRHCNGCNLKIKVFKYDACRRPQEGVIFGIFVQGRLVRTAETNERGEAVFSYLHPGLYTVRELEVPEGVEEDTTRFAVHLSHACTSAIVVFRKGRCRAQCPRMDRWWPENPHHQ